MSKTPSTSSSGGEMISLVVILAALGMTIVEFAGAIGGIITHGSPVLTPLSVTPSVLLKAVQHPTRHAWPRIERAGLPQSMTAELIGAGVIALAIAALIMGVVVRFKSRDHSDKGARFAQPRELHRLFKADGIPLGFVGKKALHAERNVSAVLVGPTQSGKTQSIVVRAIREWRGPMIVVSVKSDVLRMTLDRRREQGDVKVFDPTGELDRAGIDPELLAAWSPIAASSTWQKARAIAAGLLRVDPRETGASTGEPSYWYKAGARYLAPLLFAAYHAGATKNTGATMGTVLSWVKVNDDEVQDMITNILSAAARADSEARSALESCQSLWNAHKPYAKSVVETLQTALDAWEERRVKETTATADITPEWLLRANNTLFIVAPGSVQERLQNLFGGLLVHMIDGAFEHAHLSGQRLSPELLCVLDEVCNTAPLPTLDRYASTGAGEGILLLSVMQDLAQAAKAFGDKTAATVIENHRAKLFWTGSADPTTHRYLRDTIGHEQVERTSRTRQPGGGESVTHGYENRPLIEPADIRVGRHNRIREALLIYPNLHVVMTSQKAADAPAVAPTP